MKKSARTGIFISFPRFALFYDTVDCARMQGSDQRDSFLD